jgi:hypothetical protein
MRRTLESAAHASLPLEFHMEVMSGLTAGDARYNLILVGPTDTFATVVLPPASSRQMALNGAPKALKGRRAR